MNNLPTAQLLLEAMLYTLATTPGNIITFNDELQFHGNNKGRQIAVKDIDINEQTGSFKIKGTGKETPWFNDAKELIETLDLPWIATSHQIKLPPSVDPCLFKYFGPEIFEFTSVRKDGKLYFRELAEPTNEYTIHVSEFMEHMKLGSIEFIQSNDLNKLKQISKEEKSQNFDTNPLYNREYENDFMEELESGISFSTIKDHHKQIIFNKTSFSQFVNRLTDLVESPSFLKPQNKNNMSKESVPIETTEKVEKILKDLEFKGFNPEFHRENVTKMLLEDKTTFSFKDLSFSKKVDFTLTHNMSKSGYYQLQASGFHKEMGNFAKFPLNGAFPRKDVFENFLELRSFLTNVEKWKDGQMVGKESVWLSMKENPCKSAEDSEKMWNHVKSYSHKYFKVPDDFFGHQLTEEDKRNLEKGRLVNFNDCVNIKNGEILKVEGLHVNIEERRLDYKYKTPTGLFISNEALEALQAKYKKEPKKEEIISEENKQEEKKKIKVKA